MPIKQALGRGLSALIPDSPRATGRVAQGVLEIPLDRIKPNPSQPRQEFDPVKMQELLDSIRQKGILQPVLVRQVADGYEIIAGERRYRAAKALGWAKIPAIIKNAPAGESIELALIENIQRENLNPLEEAKAYQKLLEQFSLTQEAIARAVGKDRSSVANTVRLLSLPEKIQAKILSNQVSAGHAKVLLCITDSIRQEWLCEKIIKEGLSVRQAEELAKEARPVKVSARLNVKGEDPHIRHVENELQQVLGTRVRIFAVEKGGRLQIDFFSNEDLQRILGLLGLKIGA